MRIFFYVEDEKSAMKVLPKWIKMLMPGYTQVWDISALSGNSFVFYSGYGYPQMSGSLLKQTFERINASGNVDLFVVIMDSEGQHGRKESMQNAIRAHKAAVKFPTKIVIVNICFETWLLGNKELMSHNFRKNHSDIFAHYDVSAMDPEDMRKPDFFRTSDAQFHFFYCNKLFASRYETRFGYNKSAPPQICGEEKFLDALITRAQNGDLRSFAVFLSTLAEICAEG